jgi:hypothetical protein
MQPPLLQNMTDTHDGQALGGNAHLRMGHDRSWQHIAHQYVKQNIGARQSQQIAR